MPDRHVRHQTVGLGVEPAAAQFGDVLLDARAGGDAFAEEVLQAAADQFVSLEISVAARGLAGCGVHDGVDGVDVCGASAFEVGHHGPG